MNTKVFSFGVDEDSLTFDLTFDSIESFFEESGNYFCGIFVDEFNTELVESINIENYSECFDYDEGEEESAKFTEIVNKYVEFLKNNSDYILVEYGVDCDNSWLLLNKKDFEKLKEMAILAEEE